MNKELQILHHEIHNCTKCLLHKKLPDGCLPVAGLINEQAKIVLVGEALGENEVIEQEPFVGFAGEMLNKILTESGMGRENVTILNTVNCRPTKGNYNRPPTPEEINSCSPYLFRHIEILKPKAIITLGKVPTGTLLKLNNFTLGRIEGKKHTVSYTTAYIFPCYHPSYLAARAMNKVAGTIAIFKKVYEAYGN